MNPDLLLSLDGAAAANPLTSMIFPLVMVGAVFYFFVFRPNQKEEAARKELISGLQKGDRVLTNSGIHARLHEAKGETLILEISPGAFLTVDRDAVKGKIVETPVDPAKKA